MTRDEIINESKADGGMFIVIPSVVKLDEGLPLSAQMLYGIITWKCNRYACTWATNRELGEALGVSAKRVSALLSVLEEHGHIETEIEYKEGTREVLRRCVYPIMKSARGVERRDPPPGNGYTPPRGMGIPPPWNGEYLPPGMGTPPPENAEVICNINKQKKHINVPPYSPPMGDSAAVVPDPVDKPEPKIRRSRQKKSVPTHAPERFEQFWSAYPWGGSRLKAVEAWDALAPSDALINEMARALKRQMATPQWREGIGIPHACRWLSNQRWTDKLPDAPRPRDTGGWAEDPEVSAHDNP